MITVTQKYSNVGIGELMISKDPSIILTSVGVGSCMILSVYDPVIKLAGMAHMLLPQCNSSRDDNMAPSKYINQGVPLLFSRMMKQGSEKSNLIVKIAGGAKMFAIPGSSNLDIGQKNIAEIKAALAREQMQICGADIGGTVGRTIHLYVENGKIEVKMTDGRISYL